jgi:periplasmic copper chaperone A
MRRLDRYLSARATSRSLSRFRCFAPALEHERGTLTGPNSTRIAALTVALGALAFPAAAPAHVTLQPPDAEAGQFTRLDIRVPNERDDASTEKVDVRLPDGFVFVSTEPVEGWRARLNRERLTRPIEIEGEQQREQVTRVTLTAQDDAAKIGPGEFRDFGLSLRMPDRPGVLTFRALQTYDSGEVVRWIGPPDAEEPAPRVTVAAAAAQGAQGGGEGEGESEDESDTLSVIALIAAGLALLLGAGALLMTRRRA